MYRLLLQYVRVARRIKRRLLRRLSPESTAVVGEIEHALLLKLSSMFDHLNVLQLGYVFIAMFFASNHYRRRLPQIIRGKNPLLPGADKVVSLTAAAITLEFLLFGIKLGPTSAIIGTVITGVLAPLWVPIVSGFIAMCLLVFGKPLKWLADHTNVFAFRAEYVGVILWLDTYKRLRWPIFRWALFYYITYLLVGAPVALSFVVNRDVYLSTPVLFMIALLLYALIVLPYIVIIRASLIIPTLETYPADFATLEKAIRRATPPEISGQPSAALIRDVRHQAGSFIGTMKILERRATKVGLLHVFLTERSGYASRLITQGLISVLESANQNDILIAPNIMPSLRKIVEKEQLQEDSVAFIN